MRKRQTQPKISELQQLVVNNGITDNRALIAIVMRECGSTFQDIADVMGFSRQMAETMVKKAKARDNSVFNNLNFKVNDAIPEGHIGIEQPDGTISVVKL